MPRRRSRGSARVDEAISRGTARACATALTGDLGVAPVRGRRRHSDRKGPEPETARDRGERRGGDPRGGASRRSPPSAAGGELASLPSTDVPAGAIWVLDSRPTAGRSSTVRRDGNPSRLFSVRADNLLSSPLDLPAAYLLGISKQSEIALARDLIQVTTHQIQGTLSERAAVGRSPRESRAGRRLPTWTPDGKAALPSRATWAAGADLFYPEDHLLYRVAGWASHPRSLPMEDGSRFRPLFRPATAAPVARAGRRPDAKDAGDRILDRPGTPPGAPTERRSGSPERPKETPARLRRDAGRERCILHRAAGDPDLSTTLRATAASWSSRKTSVRAVFALRPERAANGSSRRSDWSGLNGLSPDGRLVSFDESGEGEEDTGRAHIRRTDFRSAPTLLGSGGSGGFFRRWRSGWPDTGWTALRSRSFRSALETAARSAASSTSSRLSSPGAQTGWCARASEKGHNPRYLTIDATTGAFHPISEEAFPTELHADLAGWNACARTRSELPSDVVSAFGRRALVPVPGG